MYLSHCRVACQEESLGPTMNCLLRGPCAQACDLGCMQGSQGRTWALCRAPCAATTRASVSQGSAVSKKGRAALPLARSSAESSVSLHPPDLQPAACHLEGRRSDLSCHSEQPSLRDKPMILNAKALLQVLLYQVSRLKAASQPRATSWRVQHLTGMPPGGRQRWSAGPCVSYRLPCAL